jgi:hypothetical protein
MGVAALPDSSAAKSDKMSRAQHEARGNLAAAAIMFTKDILFGMNIVTLAGFALMGLTLTLRRMAQASTPLSIGLMVAGTALVFFGLYLGGWSR